MKQTIDYLGLAFRIMAAIVITTVGPIFLGIWIDQRIGTSPWGVLAFMIIGIVLGALLAYHIASREYPKG